MNTPLILTPDEHRLIKLLRKAVRYYENGDPVKDAIDDDDLIEGVNMLLYTLDDNIPGWDKAKRKGAI